MSFLTSLLEITSAAEAAAPMPKGLVVGPGAGPRKNAKDKDSVSKSDASSAATVQTAPVPPPAANNAPPLLMRLLQFGLIIEPRAIETPAARVELSSNKTAQAATSQPALTSENSIDRETEPAAQSSAPNLAFALRLKSSDAPQEITAPATVPSPAAQPVARANAAPHTTAIQPAEPAQQNNTQSGAQESNHNSKQQHEDSAVAVKAEPAVPVPAQAAAATSTPIVMAAAASAPAAIPQARADDTQPTAHTAAPSEPSEKPVAAPAQRISLSVSDSQNQRVDVHLIERAGEVRVSVRSADETLTHSMRSELGSLSGKLSQSGYTTEAYAPAAANTSNSSNQRQSPEGRESTPGNRQNQQQNQSGGQQQPRDSRGQRPAWVEEMENSLASNAAIRSNHPWQQA